MYRKKGVARSVAPFLRLVILLKSFCTSTIQFAASFYNLLICQKLTKKIQKFQLSIFKSEKKFIYLQLTTT